jgi:hypothetical protein
MGPIVIFAVLLAFVAFGGLLFYSKLRAIDARVRQECWDREQAAKSAKNLGIGEAGAISLTRKELL